MLFVLVLATPALAAEDDGPFREPGIDYAPTQKPYVAWLAGSVIIVAFLLIAFKNPHRSHMD